MVGRDPPYFFSAAGEDAHPALDIDLFVRLIEL